MKRLKFMLTACAGLAASLAFADLAPSSSFEESDWLSLASGSKKLGNDGTGAASDYLFWSSSADASVGAAYGSDVKPSGTAGDQYLKLSTNGGELHRALVKANDDDGTVMPEEYSFKDDLYIDTQVQFTPTEDGVDPTTGVDAKLVVYVATDGVTTNLCVKAGGVTDGTFTQNVTYTNVNASINALLDEGWHRLTVRARPGYAFYKPGSYDATGLGFQVYVDGNLATFSTIGTVLPTNDGEGADSLSEVSFKGEGAIDEFSASGDQPEFVNDCTFELSWTENEITALSYTVGGVTFPVDVSEANDLSIELTPGQTVSVAATYAAHYSAGTWTTEGDVTLSGTTFTVAGDGAATIVAVKDPALIKIGDAEYYSFEEAFEAAKAAGEATTLKVQSDVQLTTIPKVLDDSEVVLDLNGCTITGADGNYAMQVLTNGTLTITDSSEEKLGKITGDGTTFKSWGTLTLNAGTIETTWDGTDGNPRKALYIAGGTFVANGGTITAVGHADATALMVCGAEATTAEINDGVTVEGTTRAGTSSEGTYYGAITINGGTFDGDVVKLGGDTVSVSIPGASTAKFKNDESEFCAEGYETVLDDGWYVVAVAQPKVAEVNGTKFASFEDAVKSITEADQTVKLLADTTAGSFSVDYDMTLDFNGKLLTIEADDEVTVNAMLAFTGAAAEKGLKNEGTVNVKADLDLSSLQWGNGLVGSAAGTAKFVIDKDKTLKFAVYPGNNPNTMEAALPGFLSDSDEGALFAVGTTTWTFNGTDKWFIPVTPDISLSATEAEWTNGTVSIDFPTVTVDGFTEADYTYVWSPDAIEAPAAGTTNTYTVTVTMAGEYEGEAEATFIVWKAAETATPEQKAQETADEAKAGDPITLPTDPSKWSLNNGVLTVNGTQIVKEYYLFKQNDDGQVVAEIDLPQVMEIDTDVNDHPRMGLADGVGGRVFWIDLTNIKDNFWYRLVYTDDVGGFGTPEYGEWTAGETDVDINLQAPAAGDKGFHKVEITDVNPIAD